MVPTGTTEIVLATNRFNRVSVAFSVERNSGMDRCGLTNLTATGNELRTDPTRGHRQFLSLFQQRMQQKRDFHLSLFRRYRLGQVHSSDVRVPCP
jgi:hypothetical protein